MSDQMYQRAYWDVQKVLDEALGTQEEDSAGMGIAADVALLAQRYADLKYAVLLNHRAYWEPVVAQIEASELREGSTDEHR